jgi:DNA/RNA endonuclease YhcR with UshA esterase domain
VRGHTRRPKRSILSKLIGGKTGSQVWRALVAIFTGVLLGASSVSASHSTTDHVVISEIQVGMSGVSNDEFVELYNPTDCPIDTNGYRLWRKTATGSTEGSLVESIDRIIPAHGYLLIASPEYTGSSSKDVQYSTTSHIASNNTVILYADQERTQIVDKVGMGTASDKEGSTAPNPDPGKSIERKPGSSSGNAQDTNDNDADFQVLSSPSPQNYSSSSAPSSGECVLPPSPPSSPPPPDSPSPPDSPAEPEEPSPAVISVAEARSLAKGTEAIIEGVVTVKPGILGSQYFYIQDSSGGIQIYSSKKLFPDTHIGQRLKIIGEISESNNEKRIKISQASDGIATGSGSSNPRDVKVKDISETLEGMLVKITGKIVDPSGATFFVEDETGKVKVIIRKDTGIVKPTTKKGDSVSVIGIASQYKSEYRILPREQSDLDFETEGQSEESEEAEEEEPQDETSTEENTSSPNVTSVKGAETSRNPGGKVLAWTVAGTGGALVLLPLVLWIFRARLPGVVEKLKNLLARFRKT